MKNKIDNSKFSLTRLTKCLVEHYEAEPRGRLYHRLREYGLPLGLLTIIRRKGIIVKDGDNDTWLWDAPTRELAATCLEGYNRYQKERHIDRTEKYPDDDSGMNIKQMEDKYRNRLPGGISADAEPSPCDSCSYFDTCRAFKVACKDYAYYVHYNRTIPNRERKPDKATFWEVSPGLFFLTLQGLCKQRLPLKKVAENMGVEAGQISTYYAAEMKKLEKGFL